MSWAALRQNHRWLLLATSGLSYVLGALTISWIMSQIFHESKLDQVAVRHYAIRYASLVWLFGAAYAAATVPFGKQLRWWPASILLAGCHGGAVVFIAVLLESLSRPSLEATAILALIGAVAAAFSYSYFLIITRITWWKVVLHAQQPPA
jgi:hypothetical protein